MVDDANGPSLARDLLKATEELEALLDMVRTALGEEEDNKKRPKKPPPEK